MNPFYIGEALKNVTRFLVTKKPKLSMTQKVFFAHRAISGTPLAQTDMYFVTFGSCNPTIGSHWLTHTMKITVSLLLADTVCKHSHSLLLLVQHKKLVTTHYGDF